MTFNSRRPLPSTGITLKKIPKSVDFPRVSASINNYDTITWETRSVYHISSNRSRSFHLKSYFFQTRLLYETRLLKEAGLYWVRL